MENEWLPIGSVVILKGGNKPLMIYGRKQFNSRTGHEFDYVACFYPEGNLLADYNIFFNKEDIDKVLFKGYECELEFEMRKILILVEKLWHPPLKLNKVLGLVLVA